MTTPRQTDAAGYGLPPCWATFLAGGLIVLATVLAYRNSLNTPFVFDEPSAIAENPTIRRLWPIWKPLCPPNGGETVTGRPLLNFSFAINYAISVLNVWSYHVVNLTIHILAALLLFGILRRTFQLPSMGNSQIPTPTCLALAIALLWALHPLQTESVTYIVQRAESLVGLLYLLTLYCFIRGATSGRGRRWFVIAVLACLLGMASKEVMVSAPLIVLLYDRTFLAGSFGAAWRRRYGVYLALAATWLLLGWLVIAAGNRGGSAGFGAGAGSWAYLCTQFGAIVHYVKLCLWPHPLLLDYGRDAVPLTLEILPNAMLVVLLGLTTLVALWRWPKIGFLGAWFFAILAPTSSILPVTTQVVAEHRMYLPLAAVVTAVTLVGYVVFWKLVCRGLLSRRVAGILGACVAIAGVLTLGTLTYHRNADYHSGLSIWQDTVCKAPRNARAHFNLGVALADRGQVDEAIAHYRKAAEINPNDAEAHKNVARVLAGCGRFDEAITHLQQALKIRPDYAEAHNDLGNALAGQGKVAEAVVQWREAVHLEPNQIVCINQLAWVLATCPEASVRNGPEAIELARRAVQISGRREPAVLGTLAAAYAEAGRFPEAVQTARKALELATQQNKQTLAESIKAKIPLYEAGTPFREPQRPPSVQSTMP